MAFHPDAHGHYRLAAVASDLVSGRASSSRWSPDLQHMSILRLAVAAALCGALTLPGCAGPIERWIAETRIHQGEISMAHGDARDAELAYGLALRVAPNDARARYGYVEAAASLAREQFKQGQLRRRAGNGQ